LAAAHGKMPMSATTTMLKTAIEFITRTKSMPDTTNDIIIAAHPNYFSLRFKLEAGAKALPASRKDRIDPKTLGRRRLTPDQSRGN
jgi:hypothetical protein